MDFDEGWKNQGEEGNLKECIKAYLRCEGKSIYIQELMEALRPYFKVDGELTWQSGKSKNIILWINMDGEFIDEISNMLDNKEIYGVQMGNLSELQNMHLLTSGNLLDMPIAKNLEYDYKSPHWSPVLLSCKPIQN